MEPSQAVSEYKEELKEKEREIVELQKQLGKHVIEKEWALKKLKSLGLNKKRSLVEPKLKELSITRQCELLSLNRSSLYYMKKLNANKEELKSKILKIFEEVPIYGYLKVHQELLEMGIQISANTVFKYRKELGLRAVLGLKLPKTSVVSKEHKKYSYKLRDIEIRYSNQVWSTDITYIKLPVGFVYMAAIIDWYSKAVLSWRISNSMDTELVMDVLNEAIKKYGKPEILNSDQGSQYTSKEHTEMLKSKGIIISMDGKGRAIDNIVIERFWSSCKCELIYLNEYKNIKELKSDIKNYIEFYNNKRFHQSLNYRSPMAVYKENLKNDINNKKNNKNNLKKVA